MGGKVCDLSEGQKSWDWHLHFLTVELVKNLKIICSDNTQKLCPNHPNTHKKSSSI